MIHRFFNLTYVLIERLKKEAFLLSAFLLFLILYMSCFMPDFTHAAVISKTLTRPINNLGLVGWWTMDGKNMVTNIADLSGQGNTGYLFGQTSTTTVPGKIGQALSFDGVDDYVNLGSSVLSGATSFSISMWLNLSSNDFDGTLKVVLDDSSGSPTGNNGIIFMLNDDEVQSTNGILAEWKVSGGSPVCVNMYVDNIFSVDRKWYNIILTWDGSNKTLYVNGVSHIHNGGGSCAGTGNYVPRSANMYLGALNDNTIKNFRGFMDNVRIYNRALSASEVKQLYNLGR